MYLVDQLDFLRQEENPGSIAPGKFNFDLGPVKIDVW